MEDSLFVVDVWEETQGYGPERLFKGWGGEELYLNFKMALLDKSAWIDRKLIHYHYSEPDIAITAKGQL
jgi:hypothetical protein